MAGFTALKLANKIRKDTKQTTTSLADADLLLLINPIKDHFSELIAQRDIKGNYFILPTLFTLVAGQREYAQPDDVLDHIYSVEWAFSNATDEFGDLPYQVSTKDDFRKWKCARIEQNIQAHYTNQHPRHEIQRRSIFLLSGAIDATTLGASTVTNGGRLRYRVYPADLTALTDDTTDLSVDPTTTTFGFPRQFHELWARACAMEWKAQHPGAVPATTLEANYANDLEAKLEGIEGNDFSEELIGTIPRSNGDGYDL